MSTLVFIVVLAAAVLHAVWNALVKGGKDKTLNMAAVIIGHLPLALPLLLFVPAPNPASYPYLLGGILLHFGYQIFLLNSYKIGDLTQVYPLARGVAPLLVAMVSVLFLGTMLGTLQWIAVLAISIGIISLGLVRSTDGLRNPRATLFALITGCFIAGYSIVDGTGARLSGSPLGFYCWLGSANALVFMVYLALIDKTILTKLARQGKKLFLFGGSASFIAYSLVIWAFTQAPIASVTALRETSIIFALLIGVFVLNERLNLAKAFAIAATLAGAILLRFART